MNSTILIKGGLIVCDEITPPTQGDILINNGIIVELGVLINAPPNSVVVNASGLVIFPGFIDTRVHLQHPQGPYQIYTSDDFRSGSISAALGGTTTIIDFVEPKEGDLLKTAIARRKAEADGKVIIDYSLHMTIPKADPKILSQIPQVIAEGVSSFMIYMSHPLYRIPAEQVSLVIQTISSQGGLSILQCEDANMVQEVIEKCSKQQQYLHPKFHSLCHTPEAECKSVEYVVNVVCKEMKRRGMNPRIHVSPITTAKSARLLRDSHSKEGLDITADVFIHHLMLDEERGKVDDISAASAVMCTPPLRSQKEIMELIPEVESGESVITMITSDHSPFTSKERLGFRTIPDYIMNSNGIPEPKPQNNPWWKGSVASPPSPPPFYFLPQGLATIELRSILSYTLGVNQRGWNLNHFVKYMSTSAAKRFNLFPKKGCIRKGSDADLVLWDPSAVVKLSLPTAHMICDQFPFDGFQMKGAPRMVFVKGECIKKDVLGTCLNVAPRGVFIRRS